ncbi:MAG TPA: glycoside hydrolase family 88 protein, partial [Planctomycetota bacterium]|nr:glycoside hydrolase family 88 protein [Planctomycetota bacterium]
MRAFCLALLLLVLDSPALHASDLTIVQPRDQGLVLGDTALVEIKGDAVPASCQLDGVACVPSGGWIALPYAHCWVGSFAVAPHAHHELELFPTTGATAVVHFDATPGGSVALGDLVLHHFLAKDPPPGMAWNWGPGVFLHGLHAFAEVSPEKANYLAEIESYYNQHLAQGLPSIDRPDMCTPGLAALELARTDGIKTALPAASKVADYVRSEKRDALGAIDHLGSNSPERFWAQLSIVLAPWAHSIWVDSLMMYGVFSAEWGNAESEPALLDFGVDQPRIFADVLQDPVSGLFTH